MPTNLILNILNYNDANLTNGKVYSISDSYACNYPLDVNTVFILDVTLSSLYITASSGDFYDLLGCDIQNNNVPVRKWLLGGTGEILEIDYIISETEAVLKQPSSYTISSVEFLVIDYWGQPQVEETILANVDGIGATGVLANTKIGPLTINLGIAQSFEFGSDPISVQIGVAQGCEITVIYQT